MICDLLTKIDLTESANYPNSFPLLAKNVASKCRSIWPVDHGCVIAGVADPLQVAIVTILESFHESIWTNISNGETGALECLGAAVGGDINDWLENYGIEICDSMTQRVLTGIFAGTDFATLCGQGEGESRWCS